MATRTQQTPAGELHSISPVSRFFCRLAGSDLGILEEASHEISRHVGTGAIILTTACFAGISMGFAISTISGNLWFALGVAVLWGLAIFNLDRFIVASFKKNKNKLTELKIALPRIILAILLGATISIPLELEVFNNEIEVEMKLMSTEFNTLNQQKQEDWYQAKLRPYQKEKKDLEIRNKELHDEIERFSPRIQQVAYQLADEMGGKGRTGKYGEGPVAKELRSQLEEARTNKQRVESAHALILAKNQERLIELNELISKIEKPKTDEEIQLAGISAQLDALHRLTAKNPYVAFAYWVLFLLLMAIETAPIFVKVFTPAGSYDNILASREQRIHQVETHKNTKLEMDINNDKAIYSEKLSERKKIEKQLHLRLLQKISEAQQKIMERAVSKWKQAQLAKVRQNPSTFVQAPSQPAVPCLVGRTWQSTDPQLPQWLIFSNGQVKNNVFELIKNNISQKGNWSYLNAQKDQLSLSLNGIVNQYRIKKLNSQELELEDLADGRQLRFGVV